MRPSYVNSSLDNKLKRNPPMHAILVKTSINVPHFRRFIFFSLTHFSLAVLSNTGERINKFRSWLTCIRIEMIVINVFIII